MTWTNFEGQGRAEVVVTSFARLLGCSAALQHFCHSGFNFEFVYRVASDEKRGFNMICVTTAHRLRLICQNSIAKHFQM